MLLQFFTSFGFRTDQWILELEAFRMQFAQGQNIY